MPTLKKVLTHLKKKILRRRNQEKKNKKGGVCGPYSLKNGMANKREER